MRRLLYLALLLLVLACGAGLYGWRTLTAAGPLAADRAVVIPRGGVRPAARVLADEGVIGPAWALEVAALLTRGEGGLHAGELEFPAHASVLQVLAILRTAKPVQHRLTLAEGLTAVQAAAVLERAPALDGATPPIAEGSLLPQTYNYELGATREGLAGRATRALERALEQAWTGRGPDLPLATPREAVILASIVERETAKPEERPLVASVYLNRLRRGMKLQSDPTVVYAASHGAGTLDHGLTRAELDLDSPYNTYRNAGLPPGPICMPGLASIQAVLHPSDSPALFFVADGTGGHVFADNERDHARNVARWRATERARTATP